jgi:hypothetical protein
MRLEVIKENEEAARHISAGKGWGLWLKEMANLQSFLKPPTNNNDTPAN